MRLDAGPVRWARAARGLVAHRVLGDAGPLVVVLVSTTSDVDSLLELPAARDFLAELAAHCRVVLVDRRGTGPSDPLGPEEAADAVTHAADVAAVLRDLDAGPAVVVGESYAGGPAALALAAHHPSLVARVVVCNLPLAPVAVEGGVDETVHRVLWGASDDARWPSLTPSVEDDPVYLAWNERAGRATSPSVARRIWEEMLRYDLGPVLPHVDVPVTVVATGHWTAPDEGVRALADALAGGHVVELPREDTLLFLGDTAPVLDLLLHEATGGHRSLSARRALLTVLLTDIADSTGTAARVGDGPWRALLDRHDRLVARVVAEHDGTVVKHTGDGLLATFPLPSSAVAAALALHAGVDGLGLAVRAGVHLGEVELRDGDIGGIAVHVAARVLAAAEVGETLVTDTVRTAAFGTGQSYEARGLHELRGVGEAWQLWAVSRT